MWEWMDRSRYLTCPFLVSTIQLTIAAIFIIRGLQMVQRTSLYMKG
jgi:hypothetical protein